MWNLSTGAATRPKYNCIFCAKHNQSHTCWNIATIEERRAFFQMYKICFWCAKQHYGDCSIAKIVTCLWPQCGAKGDHNSVFCPKVTYPITKAQIMAFRASLNMTTSFACPETTRKEVNSVSNLLKYIVVSEVHKAILGKYLNLVKKFSCNYDGVVINFWCLSFRIRGWFENSAFDMPCRCHIQ